MHKFGTGNLETLQREPSRAGIDVRAALLDFHAKHYSANLMRLCVLGREPLSQLEAMVRAKFADVRNTDAAAPAFAPEPWDATALGSRVSAVPVKDLRYVRLSWPLPPADADWRAKPQRYLSHLLGHESAGSVLAALKKRGWANELYAGKTNATSCFSQFEVTVEVTELGLSKRDEVCARWSLRTSRCCGATLTKKLLGGVRARSRRSRSSSSPSAGRWGTCRAWRARCTSIRPSSACPARTSCGSGGRTSWRLCSRA